MTFVRFYDDIELAKQLLVNSAVSSNGRIVRDIKAQVAVELSRLQQLVRGKLPGMASDYRRIICDETLYRPLIRNSFFLPSGDPLVKEFFPEWAGASRFQSIGTSQELRQALKQQHEINGLLIENHYIAMLWNADFTTAEKIILGTIEFVKFAAAVYATVVSFGAAADSMVSAINQVTDAARAISGAISRIGEAGNSLTQTARVIGEAGQRLDAAAGMMGDGLSSLSATGSGIGKGIGSALEAKEAGGNLSALTGATNSLDLTSRGMIAHRSGSLQGRNARHVEGQDLAAMRYGDQKAAAQDEELLRKMAFVVIQQIRPARTSLDGDVTLISEEHGRGKFPVPVACRYTAKLELAPVAAVRIGPAVRDVVAAAAAALEAGRMRDGVYPWDPRGIRDSEAYYDQFLRHNDGDHREITGSGTITSLPTIDWDASNWVDSGERHTIDLALPLAPGVKKAIALAEQQLTRLHGQIHAAHVKAAGQVLARKSATGMLARARGRLAARQEATIRRLPSAAKFATETDRGMFARRDPLLKAADTMLLEYEQIATSEIIGRAVQLKLLDSTLRNYLANKPQSSKRPVIDALLGELQAELRAIEASPDYLASTYTG
ncbi:hypothetical protein ACFSM5_00215 [Lacibacterium aquatile]|uniref:Uncharacterized protein n=1 Tax=Lacibacterium aquatile TaxID=1168082 RepID=A0ABW5DJN1_9PROT